MVERRLALTLNRKGEYKLPTKFHREIYEGLGIRNADFLKIPNKITQEIIDNIAIDLIDLSKYLEIPLPKIGLTIPWDGGGSKSMLSSHANYSISDILASATVDDNLHPEGIIQYSPFYLKSYVSSRMGIEQDIEYPPLPLRVLNGHEAFHLWQYKNKRDQVLRDVHILENEDLEAWNKTKTEIEARGFEKTWLQEINDLPYS